ncbi:hypothetical protein GCM10027299_42460 [Larkinella ripae]
METTYFAALPPGRGFTIINNEYMQEKDALLFCQQITGFRSVAQLLSDKQVGSSVWGFADCNSGRCSE